MPPMYRGKSFDKILCASRNEREPGHCVSVDRKGQHGRLIKGNCCQSASLKNLAKAAQDLKEKKEREDTAKARAQAVVSAPEPTPAAIEPAKALVPVSVNAVLVPRDSYEMSYVELSVMDARNAPLM